MPKPSIAMFIIPPRDLGPCVFHRGRLKSPVLTLSQQGAHQRCQFSKKCALYEGWELKHVKRARQAEVNRTSVGQGSKDTLLST